LIGSVEERLEGVKDYLSSLFPKLNVRRSGRRRRRSSNDDDDDGDSGGGGGDDCCR